MKTICRLCFWVSVFHSLGWPQLSRAQSDDFLEEVIVTATKNEKSIYNVPVAVNAFKGEELAARGITTVSDIGKFVPNMVVSAFSAGHVSSAHVFIRGIGNQDHLIVIDPGVSVSIDGVYLGRQIGQNWSLSNIERVEVLRGPQGTLFGRNAIGGAVNIITKTPGVDPSTRLSLEAGTRGRFNGDFYTDWAVNDNLAISFTGGFKHRDGLGKFTNLPNVEVGVGETEEVFGRLSVRYASDEENFSVLVSADMNHGEGGLRPYTTLIDELGAECRATSSNPGQDCTAINGTLYNAGYRNSDIAQNPYNNNTGNADQAHVSHSAAGISVTADWAFNGHLDGKLILGRRESDYEAGLDDDSLFDDFLSFPEVGEAEQTSVELQLNGNLGIWDFVSGLFYFEEEGHNFQKDYIFMGNPPADFLTEGEIKSTGIFANFGFNIRDDLRISAGGRYTQDDKKAFTQCCIGPVNGEADFDEVSWSLSANWKINETLTFYGTIQSGYQSGQFPPRPLCLFTDADCFVATDNITAINYEVGLKGQPTGWMQMNATVFSTDYSDLPYLISETTESGFETNVAIVDQTSTGFEWESSLTLGDVFLLHTTIGYINVKVERDPATGIRSVAPLTPEFTWSLSPELRIPLKGGGTLGVRADYSYRDAMWGEPSDDPRRQTRIESRQIINANISYSSADESWEFALYGRNIQDERYTTAQLHVTNYILRIYSNDASEFGLRLSRKF